MSLARGFLHKVHMIEPSEIQKEFERVLNKFGFDDIEIEDVEVDIEGVEVTVTFASDDEILEIVFLVDEDEGAIAMILDDDLEDDDHIVIDLDSMNPSIRVSPVGSFIDLTNLSWVNKSTLTTLFQAGDFDDEEREEPRNKVNQDPYGYILQNEEFEDEEIIVEAKQVYVIRGGKKVRLPVVRKKRRRILTGKQRSALVRAARKRKAKKHIISRKRKRSLKKRKRLGLKKPTGLGKFRKVAGTANRRR